MARRRWFLVPLLKALFLYLLVKRSFEQDLIVSEQPLLLLSTLNGSLVGVNQKTGVVLWTVKEDPVLDVPLVPGYGLRLLPNPKDGSLYAFSRNGEQLERLPLTIPELVQISPTQGSDGLLYSARKSDIWMAVDPLTGTKLHSFSSDGMSSLTCPVPDTDGRALYIARTAYTVTAFDSHTKQRRWNATYLEYASHSYTEKSREDQIYFCSSSDGSVLSVDALTGKGACLDVYVCDLPHPKCQKRCQGTYKLSRQPVWQQSYDSPVVAIYSPQGGELRKLPMTTVALSTLNLLTGSSVLAIRADTLGIKATDTVLQSALFVGTSNHQVYALDSLVEEGTLEYEFAPLLQSSVVPLLEGPEDSTTPSATEDLTTPSTASSEKSGTSQVIEIGHYHLPEESKVQFIPISKQIQEGFRALLEEHSHSIVSATPVGMIGYETPLPDVKWHVYSASSPPGMGASGFTLSLLTIVASSVMAAVIAVVVTKMVGRAHRVPLDNASSSPPSSFTAPLNIGSLPTSHSSTVELQQHSQGGSSTKGANGELTVGKITYFSQKILGHGSQGTVVFKGMFDKRPVAIKRILPECFDLADKEVDLLRQSDQHPNVVRYFCMEQDSVFRYIALELCQATLHEYVEDWRFDRSQVDAISVVQQSMKGLAYLHSAGIVHRDIKPRNVLLSFPAPNGCVRAMISDFGLCRKLSTGRSSFSKSGIKGTEGWIAPEMLHGSKKMTCAVDIFSMGCVVYYVLSGGSHPFGAPFLRQANIEAGNCTLSDLSGISKFVAMDLVRSMISHNYLFRPTSEEVVCHCLFWSKEKQLAFFQDVSDRIEKEPSTSPVMQSLEQGGLKVVRGDWRANISEEVREDLRRFRSYQGTSVRDLLRAIRNKVLGCSDNTPSISGGTTSDCSDVKIHLNEDHCFTHALSRPAQHSGESFIMLEIEPLCTLVVKLQQKHHYMELQLNVKQALGPLPDGFVDYFTSRFPLLLIHTYKAMEICNQEKLFKQYYVM